MQFPGNLLTSPPKWSAFMVINSFPTVPFIHPSSTLNQTLMDAPQDYYNGLLANPSCPPPLPAGHNTAFFILKRVIYTQSLLDHKHSQGRGCVSSLRPKKALATHSCPVNEWDVCQLGEVLCKNGKGNYTFIFWLNMCVLIHTQVQIEKRLKKIYWNTNTEVVIYRYYGKQVTFFFLFIIFLNS